MSRTVPGDTRQRWPYDEGAIKGEARGKACPVRGIPA
jgi:hypothetical protein